MQTTRHFVQIGKAGAHAGQHSLSLMIILDRADRPLDQILDRVVLRLDPRFADPQNIALHFIHQRIHFAFIIVNPADDVGAGMDHLPEQIFLLNDVEVIAEICRRRNRVGERSEIGESANLLEQLFVLEMLLEGDDVYRLALVIHLGER